MDAVNHDDEVVALLHPPQRNAIREVDVHAVSGNMHEARAPIVACSKLLFVPSGPSACVLRTACVKHLASCAAPSLPTSVQQGQAGVHAVHADVDEPVTFTPCVSEGLTAFLLDF